MYVDSILRFEERERKRERGSEREREREFYYIVLYFFKWTSMFFLSFFRRS